MLGDETHLVFTNLGSEMHSKGDIANSFWKIWSWTPCKGKLSTSIYDLVLIYVCHFHQVLLLLQSLFKFDHYWDTRAFILDPCIQGIFHLLSFLVLSAEVLSEVFYFQLKNKPLFQSDIKLHLFTNSKFKPLRYFCDFFVLSSLLKLVNKSS